MKQSVIREIEKPSSAIRYQENYMILPRISFHCIRATVAG